MRSWPGQDLNVPSSEYRIDIRFLANRLFVSVDGAPGPDGERHLSEIRAAAATCGLEVVVGAPRRRDLTAQTSLRRPSACDEACEQ